LLEFALEDSFVNYFGFTEFPLNLFFGILNFDFPSIPSFLPLVVTDDASVDFYETPNPFTERSSF